MSDYIKRQDVLKEMKEEVKRYSFGEDASSDSLIKIVSESQGYISNEQFARKIVKALEKEANKCDELVVESDKIEDRCAYVKKAEAYRYAKEIVVNILETLKRENKDKRDYEQSLTNEDNELDF